jgi:predicted nuclease of predicted toxin-antitoxin system
VKLLLDQGLPRSAVERLAAAGIEAQHVGDLGLGSADDHVILEHARAKGMVVVTLDADFHAEMALSGANSPSVVRIRVEGLRGPELAALLKGVVARARAQLEAGALVSVSPHRLAWRRLPLAQ